MTPHDKSLLSKGLNFCPTPGELNQGDLIDDLKRFHRNLRLKSHFKEDEDLLSDQTDHVLSDISPISQTDDTDAFGHREFKNKSKFNPKGPLPLEAFILANESDTSFLKWSNPSNNNLTRGERHAMTELIKNRDITIKKADKGSSVVIMNTHDYITETQKLLDNTTHYRLDTSCQTDPHNALILEALDRLLEQEEITEDTYDYLANDLPRTPLLYTQPKIHKGVLPPPCRPIVSGNDSPSERISQFVDWFLKPIVPTIPSYIKDTTDFIRRIENLPNIPDNCIMATLDVSALYTNIPHNEGIQACLNALNEDRGVHVLPNNVSLVNLLRLVLTTNNFEFNTTHYTQISGTAMGTKLAPSYANIFMAQYEEDIVYPFTPKPIVWWRYIDDVFALFDTSEHEITEFVSYLNRSHDTIKFTSEISATEINFLDTTVYRHGNKLQIRAYSKPTDANNYLLYQSCHPPHCKNSLPYSQFLRIKRICSDIDDFDSKALVMGQNFIRRGYPPNLIESALIQARRQDRIKLLEPKNPPERNANQVFFITTFHPHINEVRQVLDKNWAMLGKTTATMHLFEHKYITGYRRLPNLKDSLVNARVTPMTQLPPRIRRNPKSGQRCKTRNCRYCKCINTTGTIKSTYTHREYSAKGQVDCKNTNLVYCITCKRCGLQYVGQTMNRLCSRFCTHFYKINYLDLDNSVSRHFTSGYHTGTNDMEIHIVDFIHANPRSQRGADLRDKIERNWIHRLRTQSPIGLNMEA